MPLTELQLFKRELDAIAPTPKAMKAMKAMKKAMKKQTEISARDAKRRVYAGKATKTKSGLTKDKLVKNKRNKIVSKKRSERAAKSPWIMACKAARNALDIKGFAAIKKKDPVHTFALELRKNY